MIKQTEIKTIPLEMPAKPSRTQVKINKQYKGDYAIAIICLDGLHDLKGPYSPQELERSIDHSKAIFGEEIKILQTYNHIKYSVSGKLKKVVHDLDAGKILDLERILE